MISTLWKTCAVCAIFIASHLPPWVGSGEARRGEQPTVEKYRATGIYLTKADSLSRRPLCSATR